MIRNLKVLGLALVAVFAMSAVVASAASAANGLLTSDGPATLDATEIAGQLNVFTAFGGEVKCPGSTITGHEVGSTTKGVPSGSSNATLTPDYNQATCVAVISGTSHKATVTMNGCDYVLHLGETNGEIDTYKSTVDVVCPAGASIIVDVYFATNNENLKVCEITVGPTNNAGRAGGTIKDTTTGDLEVHGTYKAISASETGAGCVGGPTTVTAELHANLTVKGTNALKENTNISLSHL
jgi:hypothetical protein